MASQTETLVQTPSNLISNHQKVSISGVPRNVRTEVAYYTEPEDGAPQTTVQIKDSTSRARVKQNFQPVTIYDVHGSGVDHKLDTSGFQFVNHKTAVQVKDFYDEDKVKATYYPELSELLYKLTGASKVHILSHMVRQAHTHFLYLPDDATNEESVDSKQTTDAPDPPSTKEANSELAAAKEKEKPKDHIPSELQGPIRGVHIDQSYEFAPHLAKAVLPGTPPEEMERLLKGRFQFLNIWRPIKTIYKDPLTVMDVRTLKDEELVPIKVSYPAFELETFAVRGDRKDDHKWWYMSQQTPEDVLVFKNFDSKTDGRARAVPHSSFTDEEFVKAEARQSIEARALVFYEDDLE